MKGSCPDLPLEDIFRGSAPFVIMTVVVVLILLFVPEIATVLL
jgi:TRAP-type mannitol/chloroaromatic compound transport system permease large subunit